MLPRVDQIASGEHGFGLKEVGISDIGYPIYALVEPETSPG